MEKYIGLFPLWGIRLVSVVDNADTAIRVTRNPRQINGLVNEWYLEDMSENIRSVLTSRRQNGFHIWFFCPLRIQERPLTEKDTLSYEDCCCCPKCLCSFPRHAIARMLNDQGIPNPTEYKRLQGLRYKQPKEKQYTLEVFSDFPHALQ